MKCISGFLHILFASFLSTAGAEHVDLYGQVGGTVTLPKNFSGSNNVYVKWSSDSGLLISRNAYGLETKGEGSKDRESLSKTNFSLTITNIQLEDFTSYTCELSIPSLNQKIFTTFRLHIVSIEATGSPLLPEETLTLKCHIPNMIKGTTIQWLNPKGRRFPSNKDGLLTVKNVTGHAHGEWTCVVKYQRETHFKTPVTVIDLSSAPPQPLYTSNSTSSPLHLPCSFPSYVSLADLQAKNLQGGQWTFAPSQEAGSGPSDFPVYLSLGPPLAWGVNQTKRLAVPAEETKGVDFSLMMKRVTKDDRGTYTCTVAFKGRTLKREIHVKVLQIVSSPGTNVPVGHDVNVTCSLGQPLTFDLQLKWILPKHSSLNPPPSLSNSFLSIREAREEDSGRWKCELWRNTTKLTSADIRLTIERAPTDVWLLITICAAAVVFILILILTVILIRRHRKRLMPRRCKPKFCRCKDPKPKGFYRY